MTADVNNKGGFNYLDINLSDRCNLRCSWCYARGGCGFKPPDKDILKKSVEWFAANQNTKEKVINIMGGEPLFEWQVLQWFVDLIREKVENARIGVITNCSLVTGEILDWLVKNKVSFSPSVDGCPEAVDMYRVNANGEGQSSAIFEGAIKVLKQRPSIRARATIAPDTAHLFFKSAKYLVEELGFKHLHMRPATGPGWTEDKIRVYKEQVGLTDRWLVDKIRLGKRVYLKDVFKEIELVDQAKIKPVVRQSLCGIARGMIAIDTKGRIWPCHRFANDNTSKEYLIGDIFDGISESGSELRQKLAKFNPTKACNKCNHCGTAPWCLHEMMFQGQGMLEYSRMFCDLQRFYNSEAAWISSELKACGVPLPPADKNKTSQWINGADRGNNINPKFSLSIKNR